MNVKKIYNNRKIRIESEILMFIKTSIIYLITYPNFFSELPSIKFNNRKLDLTKENMILPRYLLTHNIIDFSMSNWKVLIYV